jgi:hypothetical protein
MASLPDINYTGKITLEDGTQLDVAVSLKAVTKPPVVTPPTGSVIPFGANTVETIRASYPLAAIDPAKPGGRDTDQIIIITKVSTPPRNQYGYEVGVRGGRVVAGAVNLGMALTTPYDYVLSGHGKGADFLRTLTINQTVVISARAVPPVIVTPPTFGRVITLEYLMDGVGHVSQLAAKCRRAAVAFYQGTSLVEWGGDSPAVTASGLTAWAKDGRDIIVSLGGQGGQVNLDQVDEGIELINRTKFPVVGIDFDGEAFDYSPSQALSVCDATSARLGLTKEQFVVQITPPGGPPVDRAIATANYLKSAGYVQVYVMHQLYDTDLNDQTMMAAIDHVVAGVGQEHTMVGFMIADSHNSWSDAATVVRRMAMVKAKYPRIAGIGGWESSRPGTAEAINGAAAVLGL